ncbi:MAG: MFS transporter [Verrucomicrobia bacterium]|jgi:MFS family permease|nr:MAG: MFS transporter [Verrucomicrobiota bacterium]
MNQEKSVSRYAWLIVGLLVPVALLNYLDRQMIAAMKSSVMNDVTGFSNEKAWGQMLGQFKWVYAFLSPVGGYIADRFGRKFTICGSLFAWSAITFVTGHVTMYDGLLWTRTLMGVSEAFYIPAALALIMDYHTGNTRSRATGLHQMGIYCGVILGGFTGYVADAPALGWRWMFNVTGLVGIIYAPVLLMVLRDVTKQISASDVEKKTRVVTAVCELLSNKSFILLVFYFTLPALAGWVVRDWMPAILQKSFNISQGKAGVSATLYWQAAAILSAFFGGWLADRWMHQSDRGRIYVSAIGMALIIPALFGVGNAPNLHSLSLAIASLVLFGVGWGFFDGNNMPILSQIVRPKLRATGYGIMNLVSISFGGFADVGFGALRDRNVALNTIFGVFAGIALLSVVVVLLIKPAHNLQAE